MAYVAPRTWAAEDTISASALNQDLRDNVVFLHDPPAVRVFNSANISISDTTDTVLTFDSERWDTDGMHSVSSNTSRLTVVTAGKYLVFAAIDFAPSAVGDREVTLLLNGTTSIGSEIANTNTVSGRGTRLTVSTVYALAAADYVECRVRQSSGGPLNVETHAQWSPEFGASWLSG